MNIEIVWSKPVLLAKNRNVREFSEVSEYVPNSSGIYFFSRKFGTKIEPFYIVRSLDLRRRLRAHLKSANIQYILRGDRKYTDLALNGSKHFHFGVIKSRSDTRIDKSLKILERYLIQKAISDNIVLLNTSLTTIRAHNVTFSGDREGRSIYPQTLAIRE